MGNEDQNIENGGGNPLIEIPSEKKSIDAIIDVSLDLRDELIRYEKKVSQLSVEEQQALIEQWKDEVKNGNGNIGVFQTILRNIKISEINKKDEVIAKKDEVIAKKDEVIAKKDEVIAKKDEVIAKKDEVINTKKIEESKNYNETKLKYQEAVETAKTANIITSKINTKLNGKYDGEIQEEIRQDIGKPETQKYLAALGIDVSKPENLATGEVQNILLARASTQVMLRNQDRILKDSPDSLKDINNLSSLRFTLGVTDVQYAKNSKSLLTDIPSATKESIVDTISTINKSSPENLVSRTGDRISFADPKNEKYTYEIDLRKQPPQLSKSLNGLSISREIPLLSPEQKAAKEKQDTAKKNLQNNESHYRQGIIDFNQMSTEESSIKGIKREKGSNGEEVQTPIDIYSEVFLTENRQKESEYIEIKKELLSEEIKPEDRDKKFEAIIKVVEDMKGNNLEKLLNTGETENHSSINKMLEGRVEKLGQLQKINNAVIMAKIEMSKNPPAPENNNDTFEKNAQSTLTYLNYIGYNELGQEVLQKVIDSVNAKNKGTIEAIDLSKNPKLDTEQQKELLRVLAQLSRKTSIMSSWRSADPTDEIIAARQMNSPNGRTSLQDLGKSTEFQQIQGATRNIFTSYLYEKPQDTQKSTISLPTSPTES